MLFSHNNKFNLRSRFRAANSQSPETSCPLLTLEQIVKVSMEHPEYRLTDDPTFRQLLQIATITPDDKSILHKLTEIVISMAQQTAFLSDAFLGNYPPTGSLSYPADFIPAGQMPTSDFVGVSIDQLRRNVIFAGPSGSGKTSCIENVISTPALLQNTCTVMFCKKRELRGLLELRALAGLVNIFRLGEFPLVFFMPPPGVNDSTWAHIITDTFAQCYARVSAQRLMDITLCEMIERRPPTSYPTLSQLIEVLSNMKTKYNSRESLYRESVLYCLNDLKAAIGEVSEYGASNFMEVFFATPGLKVIEVETLTQEHVSFIAMFFMKWIYCKRLYAI